MGSRPDVFSCELKNIVHKKPMFISTPGLQQLSCFGSRLHLMTFSLVENSSHYVFQKAVDSHECLINDGILSLPQGARHQLEEVMKTFRVELSPGDLFARCTKCNSGSYFTVPPTIVRKIQENANQCLPDEWKCYDGTKINLASGITEHGVKLRAEKLLVAVVEKAEVLYVCTRCGRFYWEGSHQERAFKEIFSQFLNTDDSNLEDSNPEDDTIMFCDHPSFSENDPRSPDELPDTPSVRRNTDNLPDVNSIILNSSLEPDEGTDGGVHECDLEKGIQRIDISQ